MQKFKINDKILCCAVIALALLGIVFQYSSSYYVALRDTGDKFFYLKKQSLSLVAGIIVMLACKFIHTEIFNKLKWWMLGISVVLLCLVFIPGLGVSKYGATRWINLGITTFQPSEIAKFGLAFFIATELNKKSVFNFTSMFKILIASALICTLIMIEPNMSITICVGMMVMIMLFVGGIKLKHFMTLALPMLVLAVGLILIEPYRIKRLLAFVDPWASPLGEGYQLIQSYYALGAGGLFGVGLFNSRQKYLFLPFAESDFIFSIICEETGLFGGIFIICLFLIIIWRGIYIAIKASSRLDCYLACAIVAIIASQTLLNIAVVTGCVPPTGLPMPFVSAGGTSLVVFMASIGILDNIAGKSQEFLFAHKMY